MTDPDLWEGLDDFFDSRLLHEPDEFAVARAASAEAGLPTIAVSPSQGKFLALLAQICGARRILEIGTLGGYSTLWMAGALPPGGRLVTLERNPYHAEVAASNVERAGLSDVVDIRVGPALEGLYGLRGEEAFDLVFIDADKRGVPGYVGWAIRLGRPGTVIVVDNVVRQGRVLDADDRDPDVVGIRTAIDLIGEHSRLDGVAVQTVGAKGHDGFVIARVLP